MKPNQSSPLSSILSMPLTYFILYFVSFLPLILHYSFYKWFFFSRWHPAWLHTTEIHGYIQQLYHFNTKKLMKNDQNVPIYNIEEMLWLPQIRFVVSSVSTQVQMIIQNLFASPNGGYAMSSITSPTLASGGSFWMRNNAPAPRKEVSIVCLSYSEFGTRSFLWTQTFCNLGQEA